MWDMLVSLAFEMIYLSGSGCSRVFRMQQLWPKAMLGAWDWEIQQNRYPTRLSLLSMSQVATAITAMEGRLKAIQKSGERPLTDKEELALRLNRQYPQDVGVLSAFFLNLVKLQAGQVRPSASATAAAAAY